MNDNDPVTALSQRVNRLEKRTHIVTGLLVGVPAVVLMLGAAANQETQTEKTVVAEKFIVAGADGKERASLALVDGAPHLVLMDKDGRPRVRLAADSDGRGPALFLGS